MDEHTYGYQVCREIERRVSGSSAFFQYREAKSAIEFQVFFTHRGEKLRLDYEIDKGQMVDVKAEVNRMVGYIAADLKGWKSSDD